MTYDLRLTYDLRRLLIAGWLAAHAVAATPAIAAKSALAATPAADAFGPANPFYAPSTLPFQAPPFDRIKDRDYQPAIEAGMARQRAEVAAIVSNHARPTFENTVVALERSGLLLERAERAFNAVSEADTNPRLQQSKAQLAPKFAAQQDAIFLNARLFARVAEVYRQRESLPLDPEARRLLELTYDEFVHAGAKLQGTEKARVARLNEEASTLSDGFSNKVLAATREAAYHTTSAAALSGLSDAQLAAAAQAAKARKLDGYVLPLQNTTQQPDFVSLTDRATRRAIFDNSWGRTERGDANDTRQTLARLAQLRAERAKLLGYPNHAAWKLEDQMAKTPAAALEFMNALVPLATAKAAGEGAEIQGLIDAEHGDFTLEAWDWSYYGEQARKARFALDDAAIRPYFELGTVLTDGVFYAANQLYGITFTERRDIPVYHPDVRVFEVREADGRPLALFYCDYFKRDNKNGGAWMSSFVGQSSLRGTLPVVYNVANLPKPAAGAPALISFEDVTTLFHEFGHALHGMFANTRYPSLSGTATPRDFVEFPSQFNEHWAIYPAVFKHYAKHYQTGEVMPADMLAKIIDSENFAEGYRLTELLSAALLDMQWHTLTADAPLQNPDEFEHQALERVHLDLRAVPPRYRSSYFSHIWGGGYSAGYYAYLWTQMLDDDAYQWFEEHGGLTRANGDRLRFMVLSRGNTEDVAAMYAAWRGRPPRIDAMMKYRGLVEPR
jgi:peptidyl-dipeptidase Dcp